MVLYYSDTVSRRHYRRYGGLDAHLDIVTQRLYEEPVHPAAPPSNPPPPPLLTLSAWPCFTSRLGWGELQFSDLNSLLHLEMQRAASCLSLGGALPPPLPVTNTRDARSHAVTLILPYIPSLAPCSATSCAWRARLGVGGSGARGGVR